MVPVRALMVMALPAPLLCEVVVVAESVAGLDAVPQEVPVV